MFIPVAAGTMAARKIHPAAFCEISAPIVAPNPIRRARPVSASHQLGVHPTKDARVEIRAASLGRAKAAHAMKMSTATTESGRTKVVAASVLAKISGTAAAHDANMSE